MANHGYVKTKKAMTAKKVTAMLNALNHRVFKGNLKIEYSSHGKDKSAWGPHVWMLSYISPVNGVDYGGRVCWMNSPKSFEIRHGGGAWFEWWIDCVVRNEVAFVFNGIITDDGIEDKSKGEANEYDSWHGYLDKMVEGRPNPEKFREWFADPEPPEFKGKP